LREEIVKEIGSGINVWIAEKLEQYTRLIWMVGSMDIYMKEYLV